jgi:hypothetical protein
MASEGGIVFLKRARTHFMRNTRRELVLLAPEGRPLCNAY